MWEYSPKIAKIGIFLYKFAQKEYTPLSHFYNILPRGESHRTARSCQISPLFFKNVALRTQKSPKMVIFGKNLPIGKNYGGR